MPCRALSVSLARVSPSAWGRLPVFPPWLIPTSPGETQLKNTCSGEAAQSALGQDQAPLYAPQRPGLNLNHCMIFLSISLNRL